MIFVTTGTNGIPFDRLLREVDTVADEEPLIVQHGPSNLRPPHATCLDYVSFSRLVELVREARVIVTHGGAGTILVALMNGKRPLVVPRLARFGEAVDDHQLELGRRLDEAELVTLVDDVGRLRELVQPMRPGPSPVRRQPPTALLDDLRTYLAAVTSHGHPVP